MNVHFKICTDPNSDLGCEFTSGLIFHDSLTGQVFPASDDIRVAGCSA
jgi:hypothetical protein